MGAHGEAMTLRRTSDGTTLSVKGKRLMKSRKGGVEIDSSLTDDELYFRIGNSEIAAAGWSVPAHGDKIASSDGHYYNINHVDTRLDSGVTVSHFIFVDG